MSFQNGGGNPRLNTDNGIFGVHQGSVNHGFYPDYPQAPPPKYEDVISGEYLKQTDITYTHASSRTDLSNVTCHRGSSHTVTTQPDPTVEGRNEERRRTERPQEHEPETHILREIVIVAPNYGNTRRKMAVRALMVVLFILVISGLVKISALFGVFD